MNILYQGNNTLFAPDLIRANYSLIEFESPIEDFSGMFFEVSDKQPEALINFDCISNDSSAYYISQCFKLWFVGFKLNKPTIQVIDAFTSEDLFYDAFDLNVIFSYNNSIKLNLNKLMDKGV